MPAESLGGRYRIVRHLARGGMAEVYVAHDDLLDRAVAVKVMFAELARDPSFVERFRREARSAALLNHPNIVSVYDFGEDPQGYYIVMEYVAGQTLSEVIAAQAPMAPAQAISVAVDVAAGLAAAHREGIVHRDVKPANVLMAAGVTKVTDFGIARAVDTSEGLTVPGMVIGTTSYLSPEQAQGLAVDHRSDLYALGMVLYKMLTGVLPFTGDNPVAVAYKQQHMRPAPPSAVNPAVPPALDAVVAKALSVNPADRQETAQELRAELLAVGSPAAELPPTSTMPPPAATRETADAFAATSSQPPQPAPSVTPRAGTVRSMPEPAFALEPRFLRRRVAVGLVALLLIGVVAAAVARLGASGTTTKVPPARPSVSAGTTTTATMPSTTEASTRTTTPTPAVKIPVVTAAPPASTVTMPATTVSVTTVPVTTRPVSTVPVTTIPAPTVPTSTNTKPSTGVTG